MADVFPADLVQQAILERLRGLTDLTARLAASPFGTPGIYDQVPQGAKFPRVEVGAFQPVPITPTYGTGLGRGLAVSITGQIKILSTWPGDREAWELHGLIADAFHWPDRELVIPGYGTVECRIESSGPLYTEDLGGGALVRHLPIIVRIDVDAD